MTALDWSNTLWLCLSSLRMRSRLACVCVCVCENVLSVVISCLSQMRSIRVVYCDGSCHKCMRKIYMMISFLHQSFLHSLLLSSTTSHRSGRTETHLFRWLFSILIHWPVENYINEHIKSVLNESSSYLLFNACY